MQDSIAVGTELDSVIVGAPPIDDTQEIVVESEMEGENILVSIHHSAKLQMRFDRLMRDWREIILMTRMMLEDSSGKCLGYYIRSGSFL